MIPTDFQPLYVEKGIPTMANHIEGRTSMFEAFGLYESLSELFYPLLPLSFIDKLSAPVLAEDSFAALHSWCSIRVSSVVMYLLLIMIVCDVQWREWSRTHISCT